jgi:hypothetical protein
MKNPAEVLRQKETELQNLERDIEALRIAVRLCSDDGEAVPVETARPDTFVSSPRPPRSVSVEPEKALKQFP